MIVEHGVGHYDAGWRQIEAEWFMNARGAAKRENVRNGFEMCEISDKAFLYFPKVSNIRKDTRMCFYAACNNPHGCTIEVREDSSQGNLLGVCEIPHTTETSRDDWRGYRTFMCQLRNTSGCKNICLVFKGIGDNLCRLDWFRFV